MIAARHRTPGAYIEWPRPVAPPRQRRTDVAGFVGVAERGPVDRAERVEGWSEFTSLYGDHVAYGLLAPCVQGFFANGGAAAWIARVASPGAATASADAGTLRVLARGPGSWGDSLGVTVTGRAGGAVAIAVDRGGPALERWEIDRDALAEGPPDDDRTPGSRLVEVRPGNPGDPPPAGRVTLRGGADDLAGLAAADLVGATGGGLALLDAQDEVAIVAIPDLVFRPLPEAPPARTPIPPIDCSLDAPPPARPPVAPVAHERRAPFGDDAIRDAQNALIARCEELRDRVAVLDVPAGRVAPVDAVGWRASLISRSYGALYAPWLRTPTPPALGGPLRDVPPSGHVAGLYARGDLAAGPEKPPANDALEAVHDLTWVVDDDAHADMNDAGVNAIRSYPGRGIRPMGARTLLAERGGAGSPLRWINVRRLTCFIREAIEEEAAGLAFEPIGPDLWRRADRVARAVLDQIWRRGGLAGLTPDDAYSVRCDATNNPPELVERGEVVTDVAFQPPFPAEVVVARVTIRQASAELVELGAGVG